MIVFWRNQKTSVIKAICVSVNLMQKKDRFWSLIGNDLRLGIQ